MTEVKFKRTLAACIISLSWVLNPASHDIGFGCNFIRQTCYPLDCMDIGFLYTSACDCSVTCLPFNATCTCPPDCSGGSDCAPDHCKGLGIRFKSPCDCYTRCVKKRDVAGVINCVGVECPEVNCLPWELYIPKDTCCPVCKYIDDYNDQKYAV